MRRPLLGMLFALACVPIVIACMSPLPAGAVTIHRHVVKTVTTHGDPFLVRVTEVVNLAPADSDKDGLANGEDPCPHASGPGGCPPAPPVAQDSPALIAPTAPVVTQTVAPAPVSTGGCPSYMAAEATSPDAVNPTSGASGCYQILPSTAAAHGCTDVGPSCAAAICATEGPGAWAASGANPCPYVEP